MLAWMQKWVDNPAKAKQRCVRLLTESALPYLRDVVIPDEVGGYTQIDHVLLTAQGLVLMEWQHFSGMLHGSDFSQEWTRFEGKERHEFVNPLRRVHQLVSMLDQLVLGEKVGVPMQGFLLMSGGAHFAKGWPQGVLDQDGLRIWLAGQSAVIPARYQTVWRVLLSRVACEPVTALAHSSPAQTVQTSMS